MEFSLVFATRERVDLLENLFVSLVETTAVPSSVEVIPVIDDDDLTTHKSVDYLTRILSNFRVEFKSRPRSSMLNEDYINWGARKSRGNYIFILNDDVLFKTKDWDTRTLNKLNEYLSDKPDKVVYGLTDDGMDQLRVQQRLEYTGFPIVSKEGFEALGYAMHPSFSGWGADIDLFSIYKSVGRICNIKSEVLAFHVSPHTETRERDAINQHVAHISTQRRDDSTFQEDIKKLKSYICKKNPEKSQKIEPEKVAPIITNHHTVVKNMMTERYLQRISHIKNKK